MWNEMFSTSGLTSMWEEFTFPQQKLQKGTTTSSHLSSDSQGDHKSHLIQKSKPNGLLNLLANTAG